MKLIQFLFCFLLAFNVNAANKKASQVTEQEANSILRITCQGEDVGADILINDKFKGECPLDVKIAEGSYKLQVVKTIDETYERYFEQDIRMGDNVSKKIEAILNVQLNKKAQKLETQRLEAEQAEAKRLEEERLEAVRVEAKRLEDAKLEAERAETKRLDEAKRVEAQKRDDEAKAKQAVLMPLYKLADTGDTDAMLKIADVLLKEEVSAENDQEIIKWIQKAVDAGSVHSMYRLGQCYEYGIGTSVNKEQAFAMYQKAALGNDPGGIGGVAAFNYNGWIGGKPDYNQALIWAKKAAEAGDARGMNVLRNLYLHGYAGLAKDIVKSNNWLERAATAGDPRALYTLGYAYFSGGGFPLDEKKALQLFNEVVAMGRLGGTATGEAMMQIGKFYYFGRADIPKDKEKALEWYQKATNNGSPEGMFALGEMYWSGGTSLGKNDTKALELYRKSAAGGYGGSMNNIGWFYQYGLGGLIVDKTQAAAWYLKARDAGVPNAMANYNSLK